MALQIDMVRLNELMLDFHMLSDVKICLFDDERNEIIACPPRHCQFCQIMHSHPDTYQLCLKSNQSSFDACRETGNLVLYRCHAGLIEATAPLTDHNLIIGYIMAGQVTDSISHQPLQSHIHQLASLSGVPELELQAAADQVTYKPMAEIKATVKILEACISHVLLNQLVSVPQQQLIHKINDYIEAHLHEDITAASLCRRMQISRTRLYVLARDHLGMGIGQYIRQKRLIRAAELLQRGQDKITSIADQCGFNDHSYFSKAFRKAFGVSPTEFRADKSHRT